MPSGFHGVCIAIRGGLLQTVDFSFFSISKACKHKSCAAILHQYRPNITREVVRFARDSVAKSCMILPVF